MKRILPLSICIFLFVSTIQAQKKSELIAQNQDLKYRLDSINRIVSKAEQNEKISVLKADELQNQVTELQAANATLLKNLNSFAALSSQNSKNINKTLATLERKEAQLKGLVDGFASADSTALVILTNAKKTLGENAKVQVNDGVVIVSEKLDFFFADGLGTNLLDTSKEWLTNVAKLINASPKAAVTITGMSITGEFDVAMSQANTVAGILIKDNSVSGTRLNVKSGDGGFNESIQIKLHPDYKAFYEGAKADIKN